MGTQTKICLHCECTGTSDSNFFEIFDETGQELELPSLVEKYFHLNPNNFISDVLCSDCVDKLLQCYDKDLQEDELQNPEKTKKSQDAAPKIIIDIPTEETETEIETETEKLNESIFNAESAAAANHTSCNVISDVNVPTVKEEISIIDSDYGANYVNIQYGSIDNEAEEIVLMEIDGDNIGVDKDVKNYKIIKNQRINTGDDTADDIDDNDYSLSEESDDELYEIAEKIEFINTVEIVPEDDFSHIEEYIDEVIISDLESLKFNWVTECSICEEHPIMEEFGELFQHVKAKHSIGDDKYFCPLENCGKQLIGSKRVARHLVLQHTNFHEIDIYAHCIDCEARFSTLSAFNKHSCGSRQFKRTRGMRLYCHTCQTEFQSFKRYSFHMQFHLERRRPRFCLVCNFATNDIMELFNHVHQAHEEHGQFCVICDRTFKNIEMYKNHSHGVMEDTPFECHECRKLFSTQSRLKHHNQMSHTEYHECPECHEKFKTEGLYKIHMNKHAAPPVVFICDSCGMLHVDKEFMENHINETEPFCYGSLLLSERLMDAYICEYCSLTFKTPDNLKLHRQTGVHDDGVFRCLPCNRSFSSLKHFKNHTKHNSPAIMMQHKLRCLYLCDQNGCDVSYIFWNSLYTHKKRSHTNDSKPASQGNSLQCQFCIKKCPTRMSLSVHIARTHNIKNVKCTYCNGSYRNQDALNNHIAYMHTPIQCEKCFKVLKNRRNYDVHDRVVHLREHRYFCRICNQGFYHNSDRMAHEETHKKSFQCGQCTFVTKYENSLDVHVATIHEKQFKYECDMCGKSFGRKLSMTNHRKRHETRQFVCNEIISNGCQKSFITNHLLNRHIKTHHQNQQLRVQVLKRKREKPISNLSDIDTDDCDVEYLDDDDDDDDGDIIEQAQASPSPSETEHTDITSNVDNYDEANVNNNA